MDREPLNLRSRLVIRMVDHQLLLRAAAEKEKVKARDR
jgi:hypothetical protein